ncbi:complement component 1, r subcomponent [Denticeps clupeoides]|uniref:complement component 1, r subcomponent n=1 Tax=Denticeps clupeoides TaxID=299321 RepID=UPI0010A44929|nr:complement C1r subcomponent-like protein [Denticeps clupeoides]
MGWKYSVIGVLCWYVSTNLCELDSTPPTALYGELHSPEYPKPYPAGVHEEWDLEVPKGYKIQLTFTYLDMEPDADCFYDSLTVIHGQTTLDKFCGQENAPNGHHPGNKQIVSPSNTLRLIFQTDESNPGLHQHLGFAAFYQAIDVDECSAPEAAGGMGPVCSQICLNTLGSYFCSCRHGYNLRPDQHTCVLSCGGGVFRESQGTITSPDFPGPSPHGLDCQYEISLEPGYTITLNFTGKFHIERINTDTGNQRCLFHWLQISEPDQEPLKLCGNESPRVIQTKSHSVQLEYHTDWAGLSHGWNLHYTSQRVKCENPKDIKNGRVTPDFDQYLYRDYIHVRCDTGYKLMMGGNEIQTYISKCQSNGQWNQPLPECHIIDCGDPQHLLNGKVTFLSGVNNQYLSVIKYQCNEPYYTLQHTNEVNLTCTAERRWRESENDNIFPTCLPVCGRPEVTVVGRSRILKGTIAPARSFPWQALLLSPGRGGGAVVGDRWILTAAHNLVSDAKLISNEKVKVYAGDIDLQNMIELPHFEVESLHVHPSYNNPRDTENFDHDIALIKLKRRYTFNSNVMPLCLPPENAIYNAGIPGLVSGFGITENHTISSQLRYIQLPVVDQEKCQRFIDKERVHSKDVSVFTDNMFCAGFPEGGADSCQGDSGGAFVLKNGGQFWAAGIVSWGISCGEEGKYGVYTRVDKYTDWVQKTIEENS